MGGFDSWWIYSSVHIFKLKIVLKTVIFRPAYLAVSDEVYNFALVFHGIRFKVKRLFVVMTSNFFMP